MTGLDVRPYQLMCIICRLGEGGEALAGEPRLAGILRACRQSPARPLTLRCNVSGTYDWQNPGPAEDTPEGGLFNAKRDLDILVRLGMDYGDTLPAREMLRRLYAAFPDTVHVCGNHGEAARGPGWTTCGGAEGSAGYVAGRRAGIGVPGL
jgi:hypothetical protein